MSLKNNKVLSPENNVYECLRKQTDFIISRECRNDEALDIITASNSKHKGCIVTFHCNDPIDITTAINKSILMESNHVSCVESILKKT